jgi:nucleoside-diphosphate-sugar epimerase
MPAHNANLRAEGLLAQWNFPNNYTLSKHLAEYMVADYQQHANMPVAIVRPTLISSVARDPYPGEHEFMNVNKIDAVCWSTLAYLEAAACSAACCCVVA